MPKRKKSRKQKELTDIRRKTESSITHTATLEHTPHERQLHASATKPNRISQSTITTANYQYLRSDLLKTILLTSAIITVQLILKFGAKL